MTSLSATLYPWHIDMLSMRQTHLVDLPLPAISVDLDSDGVGVVVRELPVICRHIYQRCDTDTGEVSTSRSPRNVEGSYRTSVSVVCDGQTVSVTGNPSKFCRLDNVFGYQRIDDCVAIFNALLVHLGLPPFTKATHYTPLQNKDDKASFTHDGAVMTRVDLTMNHAVGSSSAVRRFISGISSQSVRGELGYLHADGLTASWFESSGSRRRYDKFYSKADEMRRHPPKFELNEEEGNYLNKLINYLDSVGCVREEHELKSMKLKDNNCRIYGTFTEADLNELFIDSREMLTRVEVNMMNFDDVAEKLLSNGIVESPRTAARMQMLVHAWLNGQDMHALLRGKSAFYEARSRLLPLGIDIKAPCNVTRMMPRIEVIQLRPLPVPDFYRHPSIADVKSHFASLRVAA